MVKVRKVEGYEVRGVLSLEKKNTVIWNSSNQQDLPKIIFSHPGREV